MPALETERLLVRPFVREDLEAIHRILDHEISDAELLYDSDRAREERETWLRWTIMNYDELAKLYQPPYGERAVVLRENNHLIGACGYVPCLAPFEQIFSARTGATAPSRFTTEFGLYYALSPTVWRQGYATEAVRALVEYAFGPLNLERVVAMTSFDNIASIRVMEKLEMRIERNPLPEPHWLQVVGVLESDAVISGRA